MDTTRHSLLDNKIQLYMRPYSPHWHCACTVAGKQLRTTTKEESLARAKDVARDWYLGLLGKYRAGEIKARQDLQASGRNASSTSTKPSRRATKSQYIKDHERRIKKYLNPILRRQGAPGNHSGTGAGVPHPSDRQAERWSEMGQAAGAQHACIRKS